MIFLFQGGTYSQIPDVSFQGCMVKQRAWETTTSSTRLDGWNCCRRRDLSHWQNVGSSYNNLSRGHLKWWFSEMGPLISGKSRLVKYYPCRFVSVSCTYHLSLGHVSCRVGFERVRGEILFHSARYIPLHLNDSLWYFYWGKYASPIDPMSMVMEHHGSSETWMGLEEKPFLLGPLSLFRGKLAVKLPGV